MGCAQGLWYHVARSRAGTLSAFAGLTLPLGGWWFCGASRQDEPARLARGLAIVLPGISTSAPVSEIGDGPTELPNLSFLTRLLIRTDRFSWWATPAAPRWRPGRWKPCPRAARLLAW
jgi:hypothetical protein